MNVDLDRLPLLELCRRLAADDFEVCADDQLGVVELLTLRLTEECRDLSAESWDICSAALRHVFDTAVTSGVIDRHEYVVRRLNLTAALLRQVSQRGNIDILNPSQAVELFLDDVPMDAGEAERLSVGWQDRDIQIVGQLRKVKNLATPIVDIMHIAKSNELGEHLKSWESALLVLP